MTKKITPAKKSEISKPRNLTVPTHRKLNKISSGTKLSELLSANPDSAEILFKAGLSCIGCPMAIQETLEQGCLAHGMSKKEIDKLVERLNKK